MLHLKSFHQLTLLSLYVILSVALLSLYYFFLSVVYVDFEIASQSGTIESVLTLFIRLCDVDSS